MKNMYICILISIVIGLILITGCISIAPAQVRYNLYSLDRGNSISGDFILGRGSIESTPVYYCYIQNNDGGYRLITINARNSVIYENETSSPYVTANYYVPPPSSSRQVDYIPENENIGDNLYVMVNPSDKNMYNYALIGSVSIHIPANSIERAYNP
jgi:hypothetical protein